MKTLMLFIALTASVWSSFSYSQTVKVTIDSIRSGTATRSSWFAQSGVGDTVYFSEPFSQAALTSRIFELYTPHNILNGANEPCTLSSADTFACSTGTYRYTGTITYGHSVDPTQTCKGLEGAFIDGYHNSLSDFCAIVGSTGGPSPQPLLCTATNVAEIPAGSGNFQHTVTANACTAPTGPTAPDDGTDPGEPCTENCEPTDPETPPGGDDGSDIPGTGDGPTGGNTTVGGTITDSQGNVTNINLTMDQDFSPITNRLNETNERLKTENKNSNAMNEWLKLINQNTVDGNLELKDINSHMKEGLSGIEGKLDGIKEGIDGIKDGMGTEDEGRHAGEIADLPDVEHAINSGYDTIITTMNSQANNELTNGLETIGDRFTAFESIPQIFAIASDSCAPLNFYGKSLDLCPYAATSSSILTWVLTILTMIFIITSIVADIKRVRMT